MYEQCRLYWGWLIWLSSHVNIVCVAYISCWSLCTLCEFVCMHILFCAWAMSVILRFKRLSSHNITSSILYVWLLWRLTVSCTCADAFTFQALCMFILWQFVLRIVYFISLIMSAYCGKYVFFFAFLCHISCLHAIIQIHIVIKIVLSIQTVNVTLNIPFLKWSCFSENNPCMVFFRYGSLVMRAKEVIL